MIEKDRVAVITGATGALGSVVAQALAEQGVRLALISTNEEHLRSLADRLSMPGERLLMGAFDLTTPEGAQGAADKAMEKFGRVDILLHLVGGWTGGKSLGDVDPGEVQNMLDQHLWSTFHLARAFVPLLAANGWGRIIAVSSPLASNPPANMAPYVIGKAAQEALMLTIARENRDKGITANVLQVRTIDAKHERDREPSTKNAGWTTPEEITAAILYLCSSSAHVVNGARFPLYGG